MGKRLYILSILFLSMLLSMTALNTTTASASVSSINWIGIAYSGTDAFFGGSVRAYKTNSTARLVVNVYSDYLRANISAVKVYLDWNINYTSTEATLDNPIVIQPLQYRVFTIAFTVPNTTVASNLVTHSYRVYVEHVNSTAGPKKIVGTWTWSGTGFVVYSAEQAISMQIAQKYADMSSYVPYVGGMFNPSAARGLWTASQAEMAEGARDYTAGNFVDAKTHYQNADNLAQQAIQSEQTQGLAFNNAQVFQGYGFMLMGIGLLLFGIAAIIYGVRRRPT